MGMRLLAAMVFLLRLPLLLGVLLLGVVLATAIMLKAPAVPVASWWCRRVLWVFGIRFHSRGQPPQAACVLVANHVSWLDIFLLAAQGHIRFVAKSDIESWPVINWLARSVGTLYIRRGRGGAGPLLQQVMPLVQAGQSFAFFPEGTTTDGAGLKPFHARLFVAATDSGLPVAPVAISFGPARDGRNLAPFIGADTLVAHLLRLLANPGGLEARVIYAPMVPSQGHSPQTLALAAQNAVEQALSEYGVTPLPLSQPVPGLPSAA